MHKLMRKLLILAVLGLVLAATPTSKLKTEAAVDCTASQITVAANHAVVEAVCGSGTAQECQDAKNNLFSAQLRMIAACYASSSSSQ